MEQNKTLELLIGVEEDMIGTFSDLGRKEKNKLSEFEEAILYARYLKEALSVENQKIINTIRKTEPKNFLFINDIINSNGLIINNYNKYIKTKNRAYKEKTIDEYCNTKKLLNDSIQSLKTHKRTIKK